MKDPKTPFFCPHCHAKHGHIVKKARGQGPFCRLGDHICSNCKQRFEYRRLTVNVESYPSPQEILDQLNANQGWEYKVPNKLEYQLRDRVLVALLYIACLRISEALKLNTSQFDFGSLETRGYVTCRSIKLSKIKEGSRHARLREAMFPIAKSDSDLLNPRFILSNMVLDYVREKGPGHLLFTDLTTVTSEKQLDRRRAWQVVKYLSGKWCHFFRGAGEQFVYESWDYDGYALADYVKVDPKILQIYLHGGYRKHGAV